MSAGWRRVRDEVLVLIGVVVVLALVLGTLWVGAR